MPKIGREWTSVGAHEVPRLAIGGRPIMGRGGRKTWELVAVVGIVRRGLP